MPGVGLQMYLDTPNGALNTPIRPLDTPSGRLDIPSWPLDTPSWHLVKTKDPHSQFDKQESLLGTQGNLGGH